MNNQELALLRSIIRGIPELVIVVTESGHFIDVTGSSNNNPEDVIGQSIYELFPAAEAKRFADALHEVFANGEVTTIEYDLSPSADLKVAIAGEGPRSFELKINPLQSDHNGEKIAVCICRDITDSRSYEQQLLEISEKDWMTGVYNRSKLFEQLEYSLNEFYRYQTPASFLLLDIDNFKSINDKYGHLTGDKAICHFATLCSGEHRVVDTFARIGGDEFGMLLPNISLKDAHAFAERIRGLVASKPLNINGEVISISISIGITEFKTDDKEVEAVIQRADQAMYRSKYEGKNLVTVYTAER